jgi:hypothetical protein
MASTGTVFGSVRSWLAAASALAVLALVAIVMVDDRDPVARKVAAASEPTPSAVRSDAATAPPPLPSSFDRPTTVAVGSATGVPDVPAPAATVRPDPLPDSVVRDVATGLPQPKRTTAGSLEPTPALLPPGGPSNGVVTDPATGATHVKGPGAIPGR